MSKNPWRRFIERPGFAAPAPLAEQRSAIAAAITSGVWRSDPPAAEISLGGVRTLCFEPPDAPCLTVLHLHGGAFRIGAPEMIAPFAAALATRAHARVICPAYRLAPEHPYPAALSDAQNVLQALDGAALGPLVVSGDSAGGGLAASLTSLAIAAGASPAGLILLSPWLDLTLASTCYEANAATDALFSRLAAQTASALYLQNTSAHEALVSPLFADVSAFPPTLISVGSEEVLADDGRRFHQRLAASGVQAVLSEHSGMEHVAVTRSFGLVGAAETFAAIVGFLEKRTPQA